MGQREGSAVTPPGGSRLGIIRLQNMTFFAYHGQLVAERELGQTFQVDVEMGLDLAAAVSSDDLARTVDVTELYHLIEKTVSGSEFRLLEALAGAISRAVAERYHPEKLTIRVRKPHPPIPGRLDFVEVELSDQ
jgi:dihydroneopterin aldolase